MGQWKDLKSATKVVKDQEPRMFHKPALDHNIIEFAACCHARHFLDHVRAQGAADAPIREADGRLRNRPNRNNRKKEFQGEKKTPLFFF